MRVRFDLFLVLTFVGKAARYAVRDGLLFVTDAEDGPLLRFSRLE